MTDPAPNGKIYLAILSDDFGMCEPVNEGITRAYDLGLLTDANLMAPCPSFRHAVQCAKASQIPVGIHVTFTSEWDNLRWGPISNIKSMVLSDGTFHRSVSEAWKVAQKNEVEIEFEAQWDHITSTGLKITHICEHMGGDEVLAELFRKKCREKAVPYRNFSLNGDLHHIFHYQYDSVFVSSGKSIQLETTREMLRKWILSIGPGYHLWATHCALDHPSLDLLCSPSHVGYYWARTYRAIDQALVMDPQVREWIESRGIERISISKCPIVHF